MTLRRRTWQSREKARAVCRQTRPSVVRVEQRPPAVQAMAGVRSTAALAQAPAEGQVMPEPRVLPVQGWLEQEAGQAVALELGRAEQEARQASP